MAHDFGIRNTKRWEFTHFFGYAGGIMYRAFNEWKHNNIISGDNGVETKTKAETEKALDWAIDQFDHMRYPDPTRMDDIKEFRQRMVGDSPEDMYEIWYS